MEFKEVAYWIIGIELVAILFLAYKIVYATAFRKGYLRGRFVGYSHAMMDSLRIEVECKKSIGLLGEKEDHGNKTGDTSKTK